MGSGGQASHHEIGVLRSFRLEVRVEVLNEGPIQEDAGDPALRSAGADPTDPRPREGDRRLCTERIGFRAGPFTVRLVSIALNPIRAVGDGRIGILVAYSRRC